MPVLVYHIMRLRSRRLQLKRQVRIGMPKPFRTERYRYYGIIVTRFCLASTFIIFQTLGLVQLLHKDVQLFLKSLPLPRQGCCVMLKSLKAQVFNATLFRQEGSAHLGGLT